MAAGTPLVDLAAAVTALETLAPGQEAEYARTVGTPESPLRDMADDIKKKISELEALVKAMSEAERGPGGLAWGRKVYGPPPSESHPSPEEINP